MNSISRKQTGKHCTSMRWKAFHIHMQNILFSFIPFISFDFSVIHLCLFSAAFQSPTRTRQIKIQKEKRSIYRCIYMNLNILNFRSIGFHFIFHKYFSIFFLSFFLHFLCTKFESWTGRSLIQHFIIFFSEIMFFFSSMNGFIEMSFIPAVPAWLILKWL